MTLAEFHNIIRIKEKQLIAEGVNPSKMSILINRQLLDQFGYTLSENTRFKGFYGLYKIEVSENDILEPKFIIEESN